ncbi:hypothetical protein LguiB_035275 [Lonicera macranthoides]
MGGFGERCVVCVCMYVSGSEMAGPKILVYIWWLGRRCVYVVAGSKMVVGGEDIERRGR